MRRRSRHMTTIPICRLPVPPGEAVPGGGGRRVRDNVEPPGGMFRPREGMAAYLRSQYTQRARLPALSDGEGLAIEQAAANDSRSGAAIRAAPSRRAVTASWVSPVVWRTRPPAGKAAST